MKNIEYLKSVYLYFKLNVRSPEVSPESEGPAVSELGPFLWHGDL